MIVRVFILIGMCSIALGILVVPGPSEDYTSSPDGRWYKLHPELRPWDEAESSCVAEGGHLAVVDSEAESTFLTKLMLEGLVDMDSPLALLGFSRGSDRQFTTVDGKPLSTTGFQRWSNSGPEFLGLKGGNCGSLHRDGGLSRFPCQTAAPFLCERLNETSPDTTTTREATSTTTATPITTTEIPRPRDDYERLAGLGWYKIHGDNKKWHDAVKGCEAEGTHLAVINSDAEAQALKRMMSRQRNINYGPCHCALIGFHDLSKEGHFITVFGEPLESTGFLKWGPGNPDNSGNNEDCGSLTYRGDLNDLSCLEAYPYICEHSTNSLSYNETTNKNVTQYRPVYESFPDVGAYKLHTNGKRWNEAVGVCEKEDAYLAVINSAPESDVIRKILGRNPDLELAQGKAVYLGFKDVDGNWTTIFDESLNSTGFTNWAPDKLKTPHDHSNDCGGFDRSGRLTSVNCYLLAPFVCEKTRESERETVASLISRPNSTQDSSYEMHAGLGYYKLSLEGATWYEAKKKCEEEDAHLAIINSNQESELLKAIVSRSAHIKMQSSIFLGFHDQTNEGRFETIFGEPLESTGFDKWAAWNPDNFGRGEDCGAMDYEGYLNDVPCDIKLQFFCERALNASNTRNAFDAPNRMTITPDYAHVREGSQVSVLCESPQPLIECQFKLMNGQLIDLSSGSATKPIYSMLDRAVTNYRYTGSGLANGQCGMVFTLSSGLHRIMVGCRGRSLHGGWKYAHMSLQASNYPALIGLITPPNYYLIQNTTGPLRLVWQSQKPVASCKCIMPTQSVETHLVDPLSDSDTSISIDSYEDLDSNFFENIRPSLINQNAVSYHGLGFKAGQCGIEIIDPRDWNGFLWCGMGTEEGWDWRAVDIIVAKPPRKPEITVHAGEHSEGAILEAECTVGGSRPVANITWYLGDEVIRQDAEDDSPSVTWSWPHDEQTITQKITRQLQAGDRGKELVCEARHSALPSGSIRTSRVINIEGSLINRTFDVEEFGFKVGKPGVISIIITASPKPEVTWHFDNVTVKAGAQDPTGRYIASTVTQVTSLGIHWMAKLVITQVTESDFSRDFHLTATNELGAQAYKVVMVRAKPTEAPTPQPKTTTTTARSTTRWTTRVSTTWPPTTRGMMTTTTTTTWPTTTGDLETTTAGYTEDNQETTAGLTYEDTEAPIFEKKAVAEDEKANWATSGAIAGIVIAILIVHLTLAAIMIYGRRSGWWCLPLKARRRFLPSMSMDNLMDEENSRQ